MSKQCAAWILASVLICPAYTMASEAERSVADGDRASKPKDAICAPHHQIKPGAKASPLAHPSIEGIQHFTIYCPQSAHPVAGPASTPPSDSSLKWLDFIRHLIEALAWPIVAIVVAWRVGPELKKKIPALKKLKAGPIEAEFNEEVAALRQEAEADFPIKEQVQKVSTEEARLLELAKVSPRSAIIEAWRGVEIVATKAVELRSAPRVTSDVSFRAQRTKNTIALARELGLLQILNGQQLSVFNELRYLRNQAAHVEDFETNFESANNYIQLTEALRLVIEKSIEDQHAPTTTD